MAARFQFRLESLLRVRKSLEEEAKRRLARVIALRDQAQARVDALREAHRQAVEARRTATSQAVDLDLWRAIERFLFATERRIRQGEDSVKLAEIQVAEARQALLKAHQAHLILSRLRERRLEQHKLERLREETREQDEMAVLRYHYTHPAASNTGGFP